MSEKTKRPGVVLAAAIILFVFGGLSALGLFGAALPYLTPAAPPQKKVANQPNFVDPTPKLVEEEPGLMGVLTAFAIFGALLGAVKIWAGVGILQLRPSARIAGMIVSLLTILLSIAQSVHSAVYFVPAYMRIFARENAPEIANFTWLVEGIIWVVTGVGIIVSIALWLTVILLLNSQRSRNAFAGVSDAPVDERIEKPRSRYDGYDDDDSYPSPAPKFPGETGIKDGM